MSSKWKKWQITKIANTARKNIKTLDPEIQKIIIKKFESLQDNPFQSDIKKIGGKKNIYRGRIGKFRYYFRLDFKVKTIEIILFESRGRIKQKTIQRMK